MTGVEFDGVAIYGDNLLECHRVCETMGALDDVTVSRLEKKGRTAYRVSHDGEVYGFLPCGRFGDWSQDRRPSLGAEKSDAIVAPLTDDGLEDPAFGFEHNGAASAGNNDWQRFPRVAMAAERGVPYIYALQHTSGAARDGEVKSVRHPNCLFQLAQLRLMIQHRTPSYTLFTDSEWVADTDDSPDAWEPLFATALLTALTDSPPSRENFGQLIAPMLDNIKTHYEHDVGILSDDAPIVVEPEAFTDALYQYLYEDADLPARFEVTSMLEFDNGYAFKKDARTESTFVDAVNPMLSLYSSAKKDELLSYANHWNVPVQESNTMAEIRDAIQQAAGPPTSYKDGKNEAAFINDCGPFETLLENNYGVTVTLDGRTLFVPITGYIKDGTSYAFNRPEKGMIRVFNELFADQFEDVVVLLYNQHTPSDWDTQLQNAASGAGKTNNLWREVAGFADIVINDADGGVWYNDT